MIPHTLVAIDVETTGLDPQRDRIIQIGAVKFKGTQEIARFDTFINPGRPIPDFITQITGITDADVQSAPTIAEIRDDLFEFIGDAIALGQNLNFDLDFLRAGGIPYAGERLDTYDIASIVLPSAGRYNLSALVQTLGVEFQTAHRAINDALMTAAVFHALYDQALSMPLAVLAEIVRLGRSITWSGQIFFESVLDQLGGPAAAEPLDVRRLAENLPNLPPHAEITPTRELTPLDPTQLAALLEPDGLFSQKFPQYQYREPQVQAMSAIANAFNTGQHLLVEAGTGTGKSVAYLLPAIHWALNNGRRVLVSTNTINLQDQLLRKDLPTLRQVLDFPFNATLLKGRSNYICPRRVSRMQNNGPRNAIEMRLLGKVLHWLATSAQAGDRQEISISGGQEGRVWFSLSAEDIGCGGEKCAAQGGVCPYYRNRQAAQAAHLLVVNHALLMADIAANNHILPDADYVIIDEAHHLEAAATDGLSTELTYGSAADALKLLDDDGKGTLADLDKQFAKLALPPAFSGPLHAATLALQASTRPVHERLRTFFESLLDFGSQYANDEGGYRAQLRITDKQREFKRWANLDNDYQNLHLSLKPVLTGLTNLLAILNQLPDATQDTLEDYLSALTAAKKALTELSDGTYELIHKPSPANIYWLSFVPTGGFAQVTIHIAPLAVGSLLQQHLWQPKTSVILTSATLTTAGQFDYLKTRLSAGEANTLTVNSPFNYPNSTLLYVTTDVPEPNTDKFTYQEKFQQALAELCLEIEARVLVLFTSYSQMQQTADALRPTFDQAGLQLLTQTAEGSRHALIEAMHTTPRAVLFGTRSFWEGVDLPGEAVEVVVMAKLPFDVPSDPIYAARSETFENPFMEYMIPEAILRFRQGFGRLIRTETDFGAVIIFDRRVITKRYGSLFLDSLPPTNRRKGPASALPAAVNRWLTDKRTNGV